MNKVILMGRLTRDPELRYGGNDNSLVIARFSLAVDRKYKSEGNDSADFFNCTAFGKLAEFTDKYLQKGVKILGTGHIQNNNYTNRNEEKIYGVQIILEEIEFAESKRVQEENVAAANAPGPSTADGFMQVPDDVGDVELPFN